MQRAIVLNSPSGPKLGVVQTRIQGFARVQILSDASGFEIIHLNSSDWREATKNDFEKFRVNFHEDYFQKVA